MLPLWANTVHVSLCALATIYFPKASCWGGAVTPSSNLKATPWPGLVTSSPEYQAALQIREEASTGEFIIIEGYEG